MTSNRRQNTYLTPHINETYNINVNTDRLLFTTCVSIHKYARLNLNATVKHTSAIIIEFRTAGTPCQFDV